MIIKNIGSLCGILPEDVARKCGAEMDKVECLENAWLKVDDGIIIDFGPMDSCPAPAKKDGCDCGENCHGEGGCHGDGHHGGGCHGGGCHGGCHHHDGEEVVDAAGGFVLPAFCDSHSHIVYAGSREGEFLDKLRGLSYEEIAARGGGILNSADRLHECSETELYAQSMERVQEMMSFGSGAIEIKSGYGLSTEDELKMLRVIRRIKATVPARIKATFLGAHAVPRRMSREAYVYKIISEMLPLVGEEELADFVDVFCDEGFFTPEDTAKILEAAARYGLRPKIHANELAVSGGVQVGVQHGALSVDHLERTTSDEIEALKGTLTMPVMLPGSSFFLGLPYGNARGFIDAGLPLAMASDYNPGSSPSGDMRFVMALGCIKMRLTPAEAFNACTINGAYAMGLEKEVGSITRGKRANLIITKPIPSLTFIPYCYRTPVIRWILL